MDVRLPRLGEGADSGVVASIFVNVGDAVTEGQPLLELESEKAVASIPSPVAGVVSAIHVKDGDQIKVGQLIFSVVEGSGLAPAPRHSPEEIEEAVAVPVQPVAVPEPIVPLSAITVPPPAVPPPTGVALPASPSLRKMARDLGIDLSRVQGSQRGGRIVMADVRNYIQLLQRLANQPPVSPAQGVPATKSPGASIDFAKWGPTRFQKLTLLRRTISTRMADSWNTIPHVTQFDEADVTELTKIRKKYGPRYEKKGAHLTVTSFLLKAIVKTLQSHPVFNASLDDANEQIVLKEYYHIGIAVDTEQGLIVPVIRDVDKKSLFDLSVELQTLADRARQRKIGLDEMQGGTFTISNQGGIGSGQFTPIINKPESAILGVARGAEKMVFRGAKFVRRTLLPISLSYDHRLIDGADAARFMVDLVKNIEQINEDDVRF